MTDATYMNEITCEIHSMRLRLLRLKIDSIASENRLLRQKLHLLAQRRKSWWLDAQKDKIRHRLKYNIDRRKKLLRELADLKQSAIIELPF